MENRQLLMIEDEEEICQQVADYFAADDGITLMDTVQDGCVSQEQLIKNSSSRQTFWYWI